MVKNNFIEFIYNNTVFNIVQVELGRPTCSYKECHSGAFLSLLLAKESIITS